MKLSEEDRESVRVISERWEKKGLTIIVICKKCDTPVDYLYDKNKMPIGYKCSDCGKEWRWE